MSVHEFIARVIQHIDNVVLHTRYYGAYSNILRHKWREEGKKPNPQSKGLSRKEYKINWRKMIWKIYEVDPLICVCCGSEIEDAQQGMKLVFLIDEESARLELKRLRKLKYYFHGRWSEHSPPFINTAA